MIGRVALSILAFAIVANAGCAKKEKKEECQGGSCRYVYERRVETPQKTQKQDHVMVIFSATGKRGNHHCAALFCKVEADRAVENVVISWMPTVSTGRWQRSPVQGKNMDMPGTLAWARSVGSSLDRHGPYYIKEELYARAKAQAERLNAGSVQYKAVDSGLRPDTAVNNIHAISDILCNGDQFDKFLVTGKNQGRDAAAILKVYFDKEGYIDGRYRNDSELLREFALEKVRRLD